MDQNTSRHFIQEPPKHPRKVTTSFVPTTAPSLANGVGVQRRFRPSGRTPHVVLERWWGLCAENGSWALVLLGGRQAVMTPDLGSSQSHLESFRKLDTKAQPHTSWLSRMGTLFLMLGVVGRQWTSWTS